MSGRLRATRLATHLPGSRTFAANAPMSAPLVRVVVVDDDPLVRPVRPRGAAGRRRRIRTDAALGTADRLKRFGPQARYPAALADELMGLVHGARGDRTTALNELGHAVERFTTLAMPFDAARCRLQWSLAAPPKRRDEAIAAAQSSLAAFTSVGARRYADRARRLLRDLGARPAQPRRSPAAGLSGRETEVVRLVAQGLSNTEIASRLVISPRTVTTHLQHVYARLGVESRIALVRYAMDHDLLGASAAPGQEAGET
jgi:DNA-binding CsgD family transcriptional regulator